ncbi:MULTISPECIES: hypothetical protein [Mycolicibacterium]|jgi:hypothetical protein|uniref:Intersectin-EH binding protein Ibp1 n=1 Tax=Mycolicibacterium fortuitum TaxID=1766 RepID=A0A378U7F1_MYCFO|nr:MULTISPECIES: hypothetical protein [Mycolicibacterium]MBP3081868.1 hypothetical protein [Mycolicibacterium fortuitum]NOQ56444.1 hypothetical protein [Mycolicibacterium fortuitum]OBA97636.1 hypothetical protein A5665_27295 [Mycolicibacterium fortuitum]OBG48927.1 hypothetical protein A5669_30580 [Mycolicibacterium fortuitum]OBG52855.1 hypothetical protein A5670_20085 [Mycolicibacterium fortuitum]
MANLKHTGVVGVFAVAAVLGQLAVAAPAEAKRCPSGTVQTKFEGVCVAGSSGGGMGAVAPPVMAPSAGGTNITNRPGELPTVNGIPCTIEHYSTCYAMSQQP